MPSGACDASGVAQREQARLICDFRAHRKTSRDSCAILSSWKDSIDWALVLRGARLAYVCGEYLSSDIV